MNIRQPNIQEYNYCKGRFPIPVQKGIHAVGKGKLVTVIEDDSLQSKG